MQYSQYIRESDIRVSLQESIFRESRDLLYRGADKSLARPRRKQATASEDFDVRISYL